MLSNGSKVYIIRHDDPLSHQYSETASASCDALGVEWEYHEGFCRMSAQDAFMHLGLNLPDIHQKDKHSATGCNMANHVAVWQKIANGQEPQAIIFEHDSILLHPLTIELPENVIVAAGYRIRDPKRYNHVKAGPTQGFVSRQKHVGSHAYALTRGTARALIAEIEENRKPFGNMDTAYFLRSAKYKTRYPLAIMDPITAIAWVRKSTISVKSGDWNQTPLKSFESNVR